MKRTVKNSVIVAIFALLLFLMGLVAIQPTRVHVYSISQPAGIR